ncbi:putative ABC transporter permease [Tepidimicrobium xylanilyticum]|uniref:Uncharacterized membrane protein n=1 Tax=Tepidimicrobium xylanilyticum TaxID=1123352 RepID=A0A1H3EQT2_9FIRM|nr:hypothetical protein [Tepidimicrobium xylanilyticum]SDX81112.1 Uncharacterized membrane protein [Tepidimicrobium xylanilyticum]
MVVDLFLYFTVYSFMGWIMETAFASITQKKFINRGFLIGPFTPIYGFGAIMIIQSSTWIGNMFGNYYISLLMCIVISTLLVTALEFITGYALEKVFNAKWWDYSNNMMNLKGYICLSYSLLWGLLAFLLIQVVHPLITQFIYLIPVSAKRYITALLAVYFLVDTYKSVISTLNLRKAIINHANLSESKYKDIIIKYKRIFLAFPRLLISIESVLSREVRSILNGGINRIKVKIRTDFKFEEEYKDCINDLISHEITRSMKNYKHHGDVNCLEHSLYVSYISYKICKKLGMDYRSAARGGLLHDFYLYDWHIEKPYKGLHGFVHPDIALQNADKFFSLNSIEKDIIKKHMWPLTVKPPRYKESFVVLMIDKYCAFMEIIKFGRRKKVKRLKEIFDI